MIGTPPVIAIFIEFLGDMPVANPAKLVIWFSIIVGFVRLYCVHFKPI